MMNNKFIRKTLSILLSVLIFSAFLMPIASADIAAVRVTDRGWRIPPGNTPFRDVSQNAWHHPNVSWAWINGIAEGPSATRFNPHGNITRAEFVVLLYRIAGAPDVDDLRQPTFRDNDAVRRLTWAVDAIRWAAHEGVTRGVSLGDGIYEFQPNNNITRQEIATMIRRYAGILRLGIAAPARALDAFPDRGDVDTWGLFGMRWAVDRGIITGNTRYSPARLLPKDNATRAEAVAMLNRFVVELEVNAPDNLPSIPVPFRNITRGAPVPRPHSIGRIETEEADYVIDFTSPRPVTALEPASIDYTVVNSGIHRFEMRRATGTVEVRITRRGGTFFDRRINMTAGSAENVILSSGEYTVSISPAPGETSTGVVHLIILPQKETFVLTPPDGNPFTAVTDIFQFPGQQNNYSLSVPPAGGVFRFEIDRLPLVPSTRITVKLEIIRDRGGAVIETATLGYREGFAKELSHGDYTIRATPAAGLQDAMRYRLNINYHVGVLTPIDINRRGTTRGDVLINDNFIFAGQQNIYRFTPEYTGAHTLTFARLPANSEVYVEVFGHHDVGRPFQVGTWRGESLDLRAGWEYEIRVRHMPMPGSANDGPYSFVIANPPR